MVILEKPHPGKKFEVVVDGQTFRRFPVKTKVIMPGDNLAQIIVDELKDMASDGDVILVAESALAADQGRAIPVEKIKPGFWANFLTKYMTKTEAGIGASDPLTMQVVIDEVGLFKVLLGASVAAVTKPFGIKGVFYRIVGDQARGVDGPADYVIPPYNRHVVRNPLNPGKWAKEVEGMFDKKVVVMVMDANDLGVNILEPETAELEKLGLELAFDNPLGQSDESTPVLWCKKL